jgi:hypothetical protein
MTVMATGPVPTSLPQVPWFSPPKTQLAAYLEMRVANPCVCAIWALLVKFLMIYICNFQVLSNLLFIYICKLHWNLPGSTCMYSEEEIQQRRVLKCAVLVGVEYMMTHEDTNSFSVTNWISSVASLFLKEEVLSLVLFDPIGTSNLSKL